MSWTIHFIGRKKGAIGITYPITETVEAEDEEKARLKLYEKYDHIRVVSITPSSPLPQI